eukprot:gene6775-7301_t
MDARQRRFLIGGIGQVLLGCLIGLIPPHAVPHFRSLVTSHIEFTANGMLLSIFAIILPYLTLSSNILTLLELTAYLGTFCNGLAFVISGFTGYGTPLASTVHKLFPFPNGIEGPISDIVTGCLGVCAITIIIALFLVLIGLIYTPPLPKMKGN